MTNKYITPRDIIRLVINRKIDMDDILAISNIQNSDAWKKRGAHTFITGIKKKPYHNANIVVLKIATKTTKMEGEK